MKGVDRMSATLNWQGEADTQSFAHYLASYVKAGDIICLAGDLGAGKTTFTRYLAEGLGISGNIKSPTFTIIREYQSGRLPLYHMDAYRLEETGAEGMGLEEYLEGDGLTVIEWPQFIEEDLSTNYLWLSISKGQEDDRQVHFEGFGPRGKQLARIIEEEYC